MNTLRAALLGLFVLFSGTAHSQTGGLDQPEAIGKYLNGALPSETPRPSTGSWTLTNAFPNLTFIDPVEMLPVPFSNRLMVVEKAGRLVVFDHDEAVQAKTVLIDIRNQVESSHDSGMMGLAFHPEFGQSGSPNRNYLYVYYRFTPDDSERNKAYCRLSRFTWDPATDTIAKASEFVLINQYDRHNWHNGGGLFFGNDGFLYLSVGDEGGANDQYGSGQKRNLGLLAGVLRIDVDNDPSRSHPTRRQPRNPANPPSGWPDSYSQGYSIPNDNPWLSPDGSQLEEFYAIGLRSPHRMTIDRPSGRIWFGDVGQGSQEEVSNVLRGANLQWPYKEGTRNGPKAKPNPLTGFDLPPVYSYGRSVGTCVIGGYVYRGALHPELQGKYIFGDHGSSRIWSLEETGNGPNVTQLLTLSRHGPGPKRGMSAFGVDAAGEIYVMSLAGTDLDGGRIYRLDKTSGGIPEPPALLSQTTAFSDLESLTPAAGVLPYDVIQPLWSDGADKKRWIAIPNDGDPNTPEEKIGWSAEGSWDFPIGTVLIKHFEVPGRRIETRFFIHGEDQNWFGFTYRWRPDGSDAELLPGPAVEETFTADGQTWTWNFPGRNECSTCHTDAAGTVLGVKARHLNSQLTYPRTGRTANQIVTLNRLGFFSPSVDEASLSELLTSKNIADDSATLERRARSYLDINCSQCHQPAAPTQAAFDARLSTAPWFQDLINVTPGNNLGISGAKLVAPGDVAKSIAHARVGSLAEGVAMPPLAKNVVDTEGLQLLADWINSLDPVTSPSGPSTGDPPDDHAPPVLSLSVASGSPDVSGPFEVNVTSTEEIEGLTIPDFTVTNAQITSVSGSGSAWSLSVTPIAVGSGSIDLASDKVTDLAGNANEALSSPLLFHFEIPVDPDNLLSNSSFEDEFENWDLGGNVSLSSSSRTGLQAATIGESSFLVQSRSITELTNYLYRGFYFTTGSPTNIRAGLTFWDANGVWINDRTITLPPQAVYGPFEVEFTAPIAATSVSIWILTRDGGTITLDDLSFETGGSGSPAAGPYSGNNRLENGDFESGIAFWDLGNDATFTTNASSGTSAVQLGSESFFVQTLPAVPGENIALTGDYFTSGESNKREIGFSFWKADGSYITDRTLVVSDASSYTDFLVSTTIPEESATMTIWGWCGPGPGPGNGTFTVDNLRLTNETDENNNLLSNGTFENDILAPWDTGGTNVVLSGSAATGSRAGEINANSFIVHNQGASGGDEYTFTGRYFTAGGGSFEAGFTFWATGGVLLGYGEIDLPPSPDYTSFRIVETLPAQTVAISVWVFNGSSGTITVDDLMLERTGIGSITETEAETGDVQVAARMTNLILKNRGNLDFDDLDWRADNLPTQPDLKIRTRRGGTLGEDVYNLNGSSQSALVTYRHVLKASYQIQWQNDATDLRDAAVLRGTGGNRHGKVTYFNRGQSRENISALVATGAYETAERKAGNANAFEARVKQRRSSRKKRFSGILRASSVLNPRKVDVVRMRAKKR